MRNYIRVLPGSFARKAFGMNEQGQRIRDPYPPAAVAAFYGILCLAEQQPHRGHFASVKLLRILLEGPHGEGRLYARQIGYLIEQRDLGREAGGGLYIDGWDELQEGRDPTINDRMRRYRERRDAVTATVTERVTAPITAPDVTDGVTRNSDRNSDRNERVTQPAGYGAVTDPRARGEAEAEAEATTPAGVDARAPENDALTWLAQHDAALDPNGSRLHRKLIRLVEHHGSERVIATMGALPGPLHEANQYVLGACNVLDRIPKANGETKPGNRPREIRTGYDALMVGDDDAELPHFDKATA